MDCSYLRQYIGPSYTREPFSRVDEKAVLCTPLSEGGILIVYESGVVRSWSGDGKCLASRNYIDPGNRESKTLVGVFELQPNLLLGVQQSGVMMIWRNGEEKCLRKFDPRSRSGSELYHSELVSSVGLLNLCSRTDPVTAIKTVPLVCGLINGYLRMYFVDLGQNSTVAIKFKTEWKTEWDITAIAEFETSNSMKMLATGARNGEVRLWLSLQPLSQIVDMCRLISGHEFVCTEKLNTEEKTDGDDFPFAVHSITGIGKGLIAIVRFNSLTIWSVGIMGSHAIRLTDDFCRSSIQPITPMKSSTAFVSATENTIRIRHYGQMEGIQEIHRFNRPICSSAQVTYLKELNNGTLVALLDDGRVVAYCKVKNRYRKFMLTI